MTRIAEKPKSFNVKAQEIARRLFRYESAILVVVLVGLIAGMAVVTKGLTSSRANMMNIMLRSSITGVASVGQAFVILSAGIDLSVGGVGLFCSILGASMMTGDANLNIVGYPASPFLVIPIMLLVGVAFGAVNGLSVSRLGMPALIVTLAVWEMTKGGSFLLCLGHAIGLLPENVSSFGVSKFAGVPGLVIIFLVVLAVGYFILRYTTFGRSVYAVGGSPASAWLSGIKVDNVLFSVYAISGFLAGLGGVMSMARMGASSMKTLAALELDSIAAVCIGGTSLMGGRGGMIGTLIGVLIIGVVDNSLSVLGANPAVQGIVKGGIIFTAVAIDYVRRRG